VISLRFWRQTISTLYVSIIVRHLFFLSCVGTSLKQWSFLKLLNKETDTFAFTQLIKVTLSLKSLKG